MRRGRDPVDLFRSRIVPTLCAVLVAACGGGTPAGPTRYGPPSLVVSCYPVGTTSLTCKAGVTCYLYPCAPGTPSDVTYEAVWESADTSILRVVAAGYFDAVGLGDTVVNARWQYDQRAEGGRTVSVFPGLPPQPTAEIFGSVYEAGKTAAVAPIDGALIEVIEGLLVGRTATSGVPPPLPPGYGPAGGRGYYRLLAVPAGTYRLRVTKEGYVAQEREVTVPVGSSPGVDFQLQSLLPEVEAGSSSPACCYDVAPDDERFFVLHLGLPRHCRGPRTSTSSTTGSRS